MDAYSPDFMPYWHAPQAEYRRVEDERYATGEDQLLAELAERILAARSIV
jgi:hypothetical protein